MRYVQLSVLVTLIMFPATSSAQAVFPMFNGEALEGVQSFNALVSIPTWFNVSEDRERFRTNVQSYFELALRRDGVTVDGAVPNALLCEVWASESDGGLVSYTYIVKYFTLSSFGVHRLEWRQGGVVTVGRRNFSAADVAQDCADTFANEWLKRNPRE